MTNSRFCSIHLMKMEVIHKFQHTGCKIRIHPEVIQSNTFFMTIEVVNMTINNSK